MPKIYRDLSRFVCLASFCFFSLQAPGFMNIESLRGSVTEGFSGSTSLKLNGSRGNTEVFQSQLSSQNMFRSEKREFLFLLSQSYGEASDQKNKNKGNLHLRLSQNIFSKTDFEVYGQLEYDEFRLLELRQLVGLGLRNEVFRSERSSFHIGLGGFYEDEQLKSKLRERDLRGNIYLSLQSQLREGFEGVLVVYYQPLFEDFKDERLQLDLGFEVELMKNLNFTAEYNLSYDSRPPEKVKKTDQVYLTGVSLSY